MKLYNIIIHDLAHNDMDDIYNYCCKISTKYAIKTIYKINEAINLLRYFPFANSLYLTIEKYIFRKKIVDKRYLIIFSIFQNFVYIHRIYDCRKNFKSTELF